MRIHLICLSMLLGAYASRDDSLLGKRGRSASDDDNAMDTDDSLESDPPGPVRRTIRMTPRLALIQYLSYSPGASIEELNDFLIQFGMPLSYEILIDLLDSIRGLTRMPTWLHNLLMISLDAEIPLPVLRTLGPIDSPLSLNDHEVRMKIQLWKQFCIRPFQAFEELSLLERRSRLPPCHPLFSPRAETKEWTLSIAEMDQMFAALFTIESQYSS